MHYHSSQHKNLRDNRQSGIQEIEKKIATLYFSMAALAPAVTSMRRGTVVRVSSPLQRSAGLFRPFQTITSSS